MKIGFTELTAFKTIAEHQSFSIAARVLGVSASALSHTVKNMEETLNVRLFNRTTRSVSLTEAGEQFLKRIIPSMADIEDAVNELSSSQNRPSGTIRISSAEAGAVLLIRDFLPGFFEKYPDIHVEIVVDTRFVDIVAEGFDAGMRLHSDVQRDMVAIKLSPDIEFVAVASREYLSLHTPPAVPQDLHNHRCIRFQFNSGTRYLWEMTNNDVTVTIDVDGPMTLGNTNLMVEAALAGIGIAWVPEPQVREHIANGRLIRLLAEWSPTMSGLCLYYSANRHPPTAFRIFTQALREWVGQTVFE